MTDQYQLIGMTKEDRASYLEQLNSPLREKSAIDNLSLSPIKSFSQLDYKNDSSRLSKDEDIHYEWTQKKARIIVEGNHIEFPRLFSSFDADGENYEGIGGSEGLMYDPPIADAAQGQDSVTVFLTYRLKSLTWSLHDYARQEMSPPVVAVAGLQEAWFPAYVNDEGYIEYSPWHIPVAKCPKRGFFHGNQIIPAHTWPAKPYTCSVLVSYIIEGVASGWAI